MKKREEIGLPIAKAISNDEVALTIDDSQYE